MDAAECFLGPRTYELRLLHGTSRPASPTGRKAAARYPFRLGWLAGWGDKRYGYPAEPTSNLCKLLEVLVRNLPIRLTLSRVKVRNQLHYLQVFIGAVCRKIQLFSASERKTQEGCASYSSLVI